jgi:HEPN domain-containing protein
MPRDPVRLADVKAWLTKAQTDLQIAALELSADPPFTGDAAFHTQQATEKAMKALLAWHDVPFRKTHDLAELGSACARLTPALEPLLTRAAELTQYAWKYRYPTESDEPERADVDSAVVIARSVLAVVRLALESDPDFS